MHCFHLHDCYPIIFTNGTFQCYLDTYSMTLPMLHFSAARSSSLIPHRNSSRAPHSFVMNEQTVQCIFLTSVTIPVELHVSVGFFVFHFVVGGSVYSSAMHFASLEWQKLRWILFVNLKMKLYSMRISFHKIFFKIFQMCKQFVAMRGMCPSELEELTFCVKVNTEKICFLRIA